MNVKHNKDAVIKTGVQLFCSKGYNHLGIDEICRVTGMTKGAFYNAFNSKENFLLQAMNTYGSMTIEYLLIQLNDKSNGLKSIHRLRSLYAHMLNMQPDINYVGCMINNMMSELGGRNSLVAETASAEFDHFIEVIEPFVKQAQDEGDLNSQINSRKLTELIHTTFYGSLTLAKSLHDFSKGLTTMDLLFQTLKQET